MKCPFPGMDPYLESPAVWMSFHNRFIVYLCDVIAGVLPDDYDASVEERIHVVEISDNRSSEYLSDVAISQVQEWRPTSKEESGGVAVMSPSAVAPIDQSTMEEVREFRIEIARLSDLELVTTIELLSPWNKSGEGYVDFLRKRRAVMATDANWVDIDLLIGGQRIPMGKPTPRSDYRVVISRAATRPNAEVYSWNLRDVLPTIPIPLRDADRPLPISLADVFAMTYDRTRIDKRLRVLSSHPPVAPLSEADLTWAIELSSQR